MTLLPGMVGSTATAQVGSVGDPYWANVILLANWNSGNILSSDIDASGNTSSVSRSNAAIVASNSNPISVDYSYYLYKPSGTYWYTITPSNYSDWYWSGPFTIEFWIYPLTMSSNGQILNRRSDNTANFGFTFTTNSSNNLIFSLSDGSSVANLSTTVSASSLLNTWTHIAVTRDSSNVVRFYRNGTYINKVTKSGTTSGTNIPVRIYASGGSVTGWTGALDDFRVTKNVARYTTETSFTVPSAPFPTS